ncbi:putative pectinesterase/pectinesterase inhibitor 28 [Punica granatum]|uniref:Pectinesterase n=1 Tax=Punica granatum TaxID=22663 RepID=A0A6P8CRZ3_PUNGR|nr:putative pectinesterase/pectinesterase inhibitor 28 [Punica granatum]
MAKKRVAIIAISSIVLVAIGVAVTAGVTRSHDNEKPESTGKDVSASMKAVDAICSPTDFKQTCINSLKGTNSTDPKELIKAGFNAAVKDIREAIKKSSVLKELEKDPRAEQALEICKELMEYSINDLKRSFEKVGNFDISKIDDVLDDIKVWLSAAMTYEETCFEAFENTTGNAGKKMREALKTATQMTSNGLAMVTEIYATLESLNLPIFNRRRLLSEGDKVSAWTPDEFITRKLLSATPAQLKPDMVIAKDGSGKYGTINAALKDIPKNSKKRFVIYIKEGVYKEQVHFNSSWTNLMVIGDGPTKTRIIYNLNFADGTPTMRTATVSVLGDNFIAKDIGFENYAGAQKHQAVALRVQSDKAIFYNCHMDGYQDTLYTHAMRQYYRDCTVTGTIDFVFGNAPVVFQNCTFLIRKPMENQQCIVTAQGRKERRQPTAIILQNCKIMPDASYVKGGVVKSYLGRPWKEYSRTIIMESYIDNVIDPQGWLPWMGTFGINTCFYSEYNNKGPGAATNARATWRGVKKITPQHAVDFTPGRFLRGNTWIPQTGVPYNAGMFHP